MKVNVVGAGPAGLYFALLLKKSDPSADITVFERNPEGATYGFGVVLAGRGLQNFRQADEVSHRLLTESMEFLGEQEIRAPSGAVVVDSEVLAGSVSRLRLLQILQDCCEARGVRILFDHPIASLKECGPADLIVAADGVNSVVRAEKSAEFGTTSQLLHNRFAWYGVKHPFPRSTLSFKSFQGGSFVGHYYRYAKDMSTFVAECDAQTWTTLGLEMLTDEERREFAEAVFSDELEGRSLVANNSAWRQFSVVKNRQIASGNVVLLGDAQRSMHFSIGSGTRLAMEDAIALAECFTRPSSSVEATLAQYERERSAAIRPLTSAAQQSYLWYEQFASVLGLSPTELAFNYMTRTGRLSESRIQQQHPNFYREYAAQKSAALGSREA